MRLENLWIPLIFVAACTQADAPIGNGFVLALDQPPAPIAAIDILFVVDDSGSMYEEQTNLVNAAADSLFGELETTVGGMPDLHVAVVSTDLGVGANNISLCNASNDGRFLLGNPTGPGCPDIDGAFLIDEDDGEGGRTRNYSGALGDAFACAGVLGADGCGFEQPLESMRRALDGANAENDGFLRDDALLLVVILTDEDDCSTSDPGLFDPADTDELGPLLNFRCFEFGTVCDDDQPREPGVRTTCTPREDSAFEYPIARYVDFLHGLKADPSMVMVAGMFGDAGPVEVEPSPDRPDGLQLAELCAGDGTAEPAVRLHALAEAFPARWVFTSMCEPEMAKRLTRIAQTTGNVLAARGCLLGDLPDQPVCHAFAAVSGGTRRALPLCAHAGDAGCVTIERDAVTCAYTPDSLIARAPGLLEAGEHLLVECGTTAP